MAIEYRVINGAVYAMISRSIREGDKVVKAPCFNLCRVIDKEKSIYRERRLFQYDLETNEYIIKCLLTLLNRYSNEKMEAVFDGKRVADIRIELRIA